MNQLEVIDAIKDGLMWIGLGALLLIAAGYAFAGLCRVSNALWVRLRPATIGVFAVAAVVATSEAQKRSGAAGPSRPTAALVGRAVLSAPISPTEIARGWRLESVTTNDAISYAMPTNGVEYRPWFLRGGYETHFPLDLEFCFPFGTGVVRRVGVLSGGMVESYPRPSAMSICAAREWASIVPGVGRFWWADAARPESAPYQVKLLTWENVYAGRDCTGPYNAQIELRGDGNFVTRSNNVERVYRRVLAFDWDNDGLPNAIDPAPVTPIAPSAWNQSEEWAVAAFPSNAAEIAAVGGYAAWAAARGSGPDRRLVTLGVAFDDGSAWPAMLDFGGVPVVADGSENLAFALDCGAKTPFSLTAGRLASVEVRRREDASPDQPDMVGRVVLNAPLTFPHECTVNDVTVHLDGPRSGWLCRTAGVSVALTNHVHLTVGTTNEPPLRFSLGCQSVFFLNDAELGSPSNRAERIRPVTLNLTGPLGTNGTVRLSVQGNVNPVLFQVEGGVTNRVTEATEIPLAVTDGFACTGSCTVYASCPRLGTGTITATFTPSDGGETLTASAAFRCVEPPQRHEKELWEHEEIRSMLGTANEIFTQAGIEFELVGQVTPVGTTNAWNLALGRYVVANGRLKLRCSTECVRLLNSYTASDCIELYFISSMVFSTPCIAITTPYGIIIGKKGVAATTVAHELGHALGLDDCYVRMDDGITSLPGAEKPVDGSFFIHGNRDWGDEHGRGFYGTKDSRFAVAGRLLMHGLSSNDRADIADGMVLSLTRTMVNGTAGTFNSKVGADHFKKTDSEVYSR